MIVHFTFHIHPDHREQAKEEMRKVRALIHKHGGRNLRYFASMTSSTPNRLFMYEIDNFAHFDSLNKDPDYRAVKLDSLYSHCTGTTWGDVTL
ncbi:MAG TPA: hypothetical protein VK587_15365 [bacterium]|nr:hypothetical protein [bacterium]